MKRLLLCSLLLLSEVASAQSASQITDGTTFAKSIVPTSNGQVVNPSGVNPQAWSGSASIPTAVPQNLGGFSSPQDGSTMYSSAKSAGLATMGNQTMANCASFTPGSDPLQNQACAAVNFLANKCITPSNDQSKILGSLGANQASAAGCAGSYGQGAQQFGFQNTITGSDPMFTGITNLKNNSSQTAGNNCSQVTVVTTPAKYSLNTCIQSNNITEYNCSQALNTTIATTTQPANITYSCNGGVLVGQYCQVTSTGQATVFYTCPAGCTLQGNSCLQTISNPATPVYTCPPGATLSGTTCTSVDNVTTPATISSYTCPAGQTLSGSNCLSTVTTPATVASYSCPPGQTLSGTTCTQTTTTTTPATPVYSCPAGSTLSGSSCTSTTTTPATPTQTCPAGYTLDSGSCTIGTTTPLVSVPFCPMNDFGGFQFPQQTQFGTSCVYSNYTVWSSGTVASCQAMAAQKNMTYQGISGSGVLSMCYLAANWGMSCVYPAVNNGNGGCTTYSTVPANITYVCPAGQTLSGTNCIQDNSTTAIVTYTCPAGQTVSGSNCVITITTTSPATPNYSCPNGYTLSGTNCTQQVSSPATPIYSCPAGSTLSGSNCISQNNVVTPATVTGYSCPSGQTVSGSSCLSTVTIPATVNYSCPSGSTLSGSSCITVTTIPATVNYSCVDGSAPVKGNCIFHSVSSTWADGCTTYENLSGTTLGNP